MKFVDILGQKKIKQYLVDIVNSGKNFHSYLFVENEGQGALPLALAFSRYLNCENRNESSIDSCDECGSCFKIKNIEHPDVKYSFPIFNNGKNKQISSEFIKEWQRFILKTPYGSVLDWLKFIGSDNKQGNIFSDECASIIHNLSLKNFEARYKIQIIWGAEYLKNEGNKLLKIIEEPPCNTIFILITSNKNLILPTILSRSQEIQLSLVRPEEINQYLSNKGVELGKIKQNENLYDNNIRGILNILENHGDNFDDFSCCILDVDFLTNTIEINEFINSITKKGKAYIKQYLTYVINVLSTKSRFKNKEGDVYKKNNSIVETIPFELECEVIKLLENAIYNIERNANEIITLHATLIKLKHILKFSSVITLN